VSIASLSKLKETQAFVEQIRELGSDFNGIGASFQAFINVGVVQDFIVDQLAEISSNPDHVVLDNVGQVSLAVINAEDIDLTVRLLTPLAAVPRPLKWFGSHQMLSVIGSPSVIVRKLRVPAGVNINHFERDVCLVESTRLTASKSEIVCSGDASEILDVFEVAEPSVVVSLTIKNRDAQLHWSFDKGGRSVFAEAAQMHTSRVKAILEVADVMNVQVPQRVTDSIFASSDSNLQLFLIRRLVHSGSFEGFQQLHEAIESTDPIRRNGGQAILRALVRLIAEKRN
jgi:hypothetical protein